MASGHPSFVVGRSLKSCYTSDQPFSFFGVQLGTDMRLAPTCYSIKNNTSRYHAMVSWRFEGSNDLIKWTLLDQRLHYMHNSAALKALTSPGGTSTWGVDKAVFNKYSRSGFNCFRIVQIEKNADGTNALQLSGIELYGHPINPQNWEL